MTRLPRHLSLRSHPGRTATWTAIVALLAVMTPPTAAAGPQRPATGPSFTARLNRAVVQPFFDTLLALDDALNTGRGKAPANGKQQFDELSRRAGPAKGALRTFVADLRRANETAAFDTFVYAAAGKSGDATLAADIRQAGGPVAILSRDSTIDDLVTEMRGNLRTGGLDALLERIGLTASASARGTVCSFVMFVVTLGYGTTANYRTCMGNRRSAA